MFNDVTVFNIREYLSGEDNTDLGEEESYENSSPSFLVERIRMLKDF